MGEETVPEADSQQAKFQADLERQRAASRAAEDQARERFHAALAQARGMTLGAAHDLLQNAVIDEVMVYEFLDFGSRGLMISTPNNEGSALRLTFFRIASMKDEMLRDCLVDWAVTGHAPPRKFFWHK